MTLLSNDPINTFYCDILCNFCVCAFEDHVNEFVIQTNHIIALSIMISNAFFSTYPGVNSMNPIHKDAFVHTLMLRSETIENHKWAKQSTDKKILK